MNINNIMIAVAAVFLILYLVRRRTRLSREDD